LGDGDHDQDDEDLQLFAMKGGAGVLGRLPPC
jgi:hypothetical protein